MTRLFLVISLSVVLAVAAFAASNSPESAQRDTEENYLPKLNLACGTQLSVAYDAASLVKHNKDIQYDQTGGDRECNEPLRYLWYLCKDSAGKESVKAMRLSKVVCKGTAAKEGSLTLVRGTLTVERAFEESQWFVRSRKQFEAIFKTELPLPSEDPYQDQEWRELKSKPNPVTDTKTYCLVNGERVEWNESVSDSFVHRKEDATVKCWKDGEQVTSLTIKQGFKTGYETYFGHGFVMRTNYLDGRKDGEERTTTNGKLSELTLFAKGQEQVRTSYHPNGNLSRYTRHYPDHIDELSLTENGKVLNVRCSVQARNDKVLRKWCGFDGEATHSVYDGNGKILRVSTFKDGILQREGRGAGDYSSGRDVQYKDGKKQGEERIVDKTGKLQGSITWNHGVKDGKELKYADDGKRVVSESIWKAGELQQVTEFYLNGNPKQREVISSQKKELKRFWDTGKVAAGGTFVSCRTRDGGWCEEGVHRTYYENGKPESETTWKAGQRHGVAKSWWENGRPSNIEEYVNDHRTKRKSWDKDGKLTLDEEYESDGSRKLKR